MKDLLCVYNTCGIRGNDNSDYYIKALNSILSQEGVTFDVVFSDCLNSEFVRNKIKSYFGNKISYNFVNEIVPVNVSMNHSVKQMVKSNGNYGGYVYIDSGVNLPTTTILKQMNDVYVSGPYGMVCSNATNDNGIFWNLGFYEPPYTPFPVPIGKGIHPHCQIYSAKLFDYYGGCIPDIFASFCTESVFTFLCAALRTQWVYCHEILVEHHTSIDGPSSGFLHEHSKVWPTQNRGAGIWNHTFRSKRSLAEIVADPAAYACGFGFEEVQQILMHDPSQFDEYGFCKNDQLKEFVRTNMFLKHDELDYNQIKSTFVR